jgi:hypothetical protein
MQRGANQTNGNQESYDAVLTEKNFQRLTLVQVTSGDVHSFKIGFFRALLKALANSRHGYEIVSLEMVFWWKSRNWTCFG